MKIKRTTTSATMIKVSFWKEKFETCSSGRDTGAESVRKSRKERPGRKENLAKAEAKERAKGDEANDEKAFFPKEVASSTDAKEKFRKVKENPGSRREGPTKVRLSKKKATKKIQE